jgi:hypothetical protein
MFPASCALAKMTAAARRDPRQFGQGANPDMSQARKCPSGNPAIVDKKYI